MNTYIGIDPGKHGYISIFYDDDYEDAEKYPMPLNDIEDVCGYGLADMFNTLSMKSDKLFVVLEKLTGRQGWAANANYTFGKGVGEIHGVLKTLDIDFNDVIPKVWQKEIWENCDIVKKLSKGGKRMETDTKTTSYNAAKRLFPNAILKEEKEKKYYKNTYQNRKLKRVGMEIPQKSDSLFHDGLVDSLLIAEYCRRTVNKG